MMAAGVRMKCRLLLGYEDFLRSLAARDKFAKIPDHPSLGSMASIGILGHDMFVY